jgi:hypothetical protein
MAGEEARTRRLLGVGAVVIAAGIALVGTSHPDVGGVVLLAGWAVMGAAIHRFGRGAA